MTTFDYAAPAELFAAGSANLRKSRVHYKRFPQAAEAIRFAVEQLGPRLLRASSIEVDDTRYTGEEIERLYVSEDFPLRRGARVGVDPKH